MSKMKPVWHGISIISMLVALIIGVLIAPNVHGEEEFAEEQTVAEFGTVDQIRINRAWPIRYGLPDPERRLTEGWLIRGGARVYARHCLGCHGAEGGGDGEDSKELFPPPRDFQEGIFKFHDGQARDKPSRHSLRETLRLGLPGTEMPSFAEFDDLWVDALVEYVRWLAMRGEFKSLPPPFRIGLEILIRRIWKRLLTTCVTCWPVPGQRLGKVCRNLGLALSHPK